MAALGWTHLLDVVDAAKAPAARQRPEDLHLAVLALGEGLVQAPLSGRTHLQGQPRFTPFTFYQVLNAAQHP